MANLTIYLDDLYKISEEEFTLELDIERVLEECDQEETLVCMDWIIDYNFSLLKKRLKEKKSQLNEVLQMVNLTNANLKTLISVLEYVHIHIYPYQIPFDKDKKPIKKLLIKLKEEREKR